MPLAQLTAMTWFTCCEYTGQSLFPVLLRGLAVAAMGSLVGWVGGKLSCLQLDSLSQLQAQGQSLFLEQPALLAAGSGGILVCGVISSPSQSLLQAMLPFRCDGTGATLKGCLQRWAVLQRNTWVLHGVLAWVLAR